MHEQEVETGPKLRLRIHYSYSDVQRFESLLVEWRDFLENDIQELKMIQEYLENLTTPFGFLKQAAAEKQEELSREDHEDMEEQRKGDT